MTPKQQSILERYGIPNPPEWSGMTGQGADAMYSIGGKWMKAGQTHPSGYTVGEYDPKSKSLGMSVHGVNIPVGMKSSTILPYQPPASQALNKNTSEGNMTAAERELMNQVNTASLYTDPTKNLFKKVEQPKANATLESLEKHPFYNIKKSDMDYLKANMLQSGNINPNEFKNILHISDYIKGVQGKSLEAGTKYYIPNADGLTDVFMTKTPDQKKSK